jgi:hypothetical protein
VGSPFEPAKIVLLSIASAIVYGVAHDQVTAHVCVEYFTIAHPRIFPTESPTLLAFGWGVVATWWFGAALGAILAVAARAGTRVPVDARALAKPIAALLAIVYAGSMLALGAGYLAARAGWVHLDPWWRETLPPGREAVFLADLWAHLAAYGLGGAGGLVLAAIVWRRRRAFSPRSAADRVEPPTGAP